MHNRSAHKRKDVETVIIVSSADIITAKLNGKQLYCCLHRDCTVPELVPVLKLVELRTNALGSEQKSLRAWQCSRSDRESEDDRRKENNSGGERGTDEAKRRGQEK